MLAIAALFGAGVAVGSHATHQDGCPTAFDVATVLGQGTVAGGKAGYFNKWGDYLPKIREVDVNSFNRADRLHYRNIIARGQDNGELLDDFSRSALDEVPERQPRPFAMPAELEDGYTGVKNINPNDYYTTRARTEAEIQEFFAPTVRILTMALNVVEWGFMPMYGSCFGILSGDPGNLAGPDEGGQMNVSKSRFATANGWLCYAYPADCWDGDAAYEYAVDEGIMLDLTAQAGIDGLISLVADPISSTSLNAQAHIVISFQAWQVELMMMCLAAIGFGLMMCIIIALAAGGASWQFQLTMAGIGVSAAAILTGVMAGAWSSENVDNLNALAAKYHALAAQVPSAVPAGPPLGKSLASASAVGMFADLNVSAMSDEATSAGLPAQHGESGESTRNAQSVSSTALHPSGLVSSAPLVTERSGAASLGALSARRSDSSTPPGAQDREAPPEQTTVEGEDAGAATGVGQVGYVPLDAAELSADQAVAVRPGQARRVLQSAVPTPDRKG